MDKMQMAHDAALAMIKNGCSMHTAIADAWKYADAMQAKADERNKAEAEQKRKEMRELLNAENTFVEREGQHFDDVNWQPDWSQAPAWAVAWTFDKNGATWWSEMPVIHGNIWFVDDGIWECADAPSFGYTGNWQKSLRERPE